MPSSCSERWTLPVSDLRKYACPEDSKSQNALSAIDCSQGHKFFKFVSLKAGHDYLGGSSKHHIRGPAFFFSTSALTRQRRNRSKHKPLSLIVPKLILGVSEIRGTFSGCE